MSYLLIRLGEWVFERGYPELADRLFVLALKVAGDDPVILASRGLVAETQSRPDDAVALYMSAIDLDEEMVPARVRLALLLVELGRTLEAVEHGNVLLGADEVPGHLALELAWALAEQERQYERALQWYSVAEEQGNTMAAFGRAACLCEMGRFEEAQTFLEGVLKNLGQYEEGRRDSLALMAKLGLSRVVVTSGGDLLEALNAARDARSSHIEGAGSAERRYCDEFLDWVDSLAGKEEGERG